MWQVVFTATSGIFLLLAENSLWVKYHQVNLIIGTKLDQAATLSYGVRETSYFHLLWQNPCAALKVKGICNLPRNRAEFGIDHSFLWKNLQKGTKQRGKKIHSTSWFSKGWEQRAVPGRKRSPAALVRVGKGQLKLPASSLQCLPAVWSCSVWDPCILQRTLNFREPWLEEILGQKMTKLSFCREMITCPT